MKLRHKYMDAYICELTDELDKLAGFVDQRTYMSHYLLINRHVMKDNIIPIRVHGGTVGCIKFDDNKIITEVILDTDYVVDTYPSDINEIVKKYVGMTLEFDS